MHHGRGAVDPEEMELDLSVKQLFLDRQKVSRMISRAQRQSMTTAGRFIRNTWRRKVLRNRKRVSKPGQPPSIHSKSTGGASLRRILYYYDPRAETIVVGQLKLNGSGARPMGGRQIPSILDQGGNVRLRNGNVVRIAARPNAALALQMELDAGTIPAAWHSSIKG